MASESEVINDVYDASTHSLKCNQATALSGENLAQDVEGVLVKPVVSSAYSPSAFTNFGAATNANLTTVPTMIKSITCTNISNALVYIQIFNLAAAPTEDSSVPIFSFAVPAGTATVPGSRTIGTDFFGESGYYLSAGLSWGISASPGVFDAGGLTASNHVVNGTRV